MRLCISIRGRVRLSVRISCFCEKCMKCTKKDASLAAGPCFWYIAIKLFYSPSITTKQYKWQSYSLLPPCAFPVILIAAAFEESTLDSFGWSDVNESSSARRSLVLQVHPKTDLDLHVALQTSEDAHEEYAHKGLSSIPGWYRWRSTLASSWRLRKRRFFDIYRRDQGFPRNPQRELRSAPCRRRQLRQMKNESLDQWAGATSSSSSQLSRWSRFEISREPTFHRLWMGYRRTCRKEGCAITYGAKKLWQKMLLEG